MAGVEPINITDVGPAPRSKEGSTVETLPAQLATITNATLADGSLVDVEIAGDTVVSVSPATPAGSGDRRHDADAPGPSGLTLDLSGFLLLTAPAEPHAHLDKALSWDLIDPPMGDLGLAIESWKRYSAGMTVDDIADRARRQALAMLSNGTTAIRCHVDILMGDEPMRGVRALVQVREELKDLVDLELAALAGPHAATEHVYEALDLGVDLVGGAPHLADDPDADLRRLLAIATRRGIGVDMHTDESLDGALTLRTLAAVVRDWPAERPVTAGHCVRLGTLERAELAEVIAEIVASDIGIVSLPITNLYLQGWEHPVATPRGLTAVRDLLEAGARLGAGADNVRDPFNPVGRSDALETASLLVTAGHLTLDEAYAAVSDGARSVMSLPAAGVAVGAKAELLAVRGTTLSQVIGEASGDRYVVHRGRLVAHSEVTRRIALPDTLTTTGQPTVPAAESLLETR
ncbi:amidohydrolase family protein [Herbiconiux sp. KACC 21604]|uniref:amidohydrolase family protein n=1 Tax=unclassified Herbiconiux TaxID=2618217 RepID=UPI001C11F288|nr:amidohydrolase family protein [Herbiconiux sp. SALV-R1]WPO85063.1 amidohydrolase family protein [Herbiconiux sp. KACC 21604]